MIPRVSVITPTWRRHERLLNRCIPSVQAQTWRDTEHVIVSDGPDPELLEKISKLHESGAFYHPVRFVQLAEHSPEQHWGHLARLAGIEASGGAYIGYTDDDDLLLPEHCAKLAGALTQNPGAGWAYSVMRSWSSSGLCTEIGHGQLACGNLGTPMVMHRRETLEHGTWGPASSVEDWELVSRWTAAGVQYVHVPEVTAEVWPSVYHVHY